MRDYLLSPEPPLHAIIAEVAKKHGVSYAEMVSPRRAQRFVVPRFEAYWRCAKETAASLPMIGRALGGRNHTTVMHGIRKYEERLAGANGA